MIPPVTPTITASNGRPIAAGDWIYPIARVSYPAGFCTVHEAGRAMIDVVIEGHTSAILEVKNIVRLAARRSA